MGPFWSTIFITFLLELILATVSSETNDNTIQTYIVGVENALKPSAYTDLEQWYTSMLKDLNPKLSSSTNTTNQILHVYKTVFQGFSASLTLHQAQELQQRPEILGLFPDHLYHLQTTRSPYFLGLRTSATNTLHKASQYGANVIIGVLDTGIFPELQSFNDTGLGPVPSNWKGECQEGYDFPQTLCNKKLIGVRYFPSDDYTCNRSARDFFGHGTHTASTAAGSTVKNASFFGYAKGTAEGVAPKARLAIYKVCTEVDCRGIDILAGFDKAVEDGVHVISISLGFTVALPLYKDVIAIGAFGAMEKGVIVSAAAGNSGPHNATVINIAPWLITVGASTIDRKFPADLLLDGGGVITGISLSSGVPFLQNQYWPLIYAGNASAIGFESFASYCVPNSLDEQLVRGKIVMCDRGESSSVLKGRIVKEAGGVGVIVANVAPFGRLLMSHADLIPGLSIDESSRQVVLDYISCSPDPKATIVLRGTQVGVKPAPVVAQFSSRGPNSISDYVMKPDVIAPGVDILAAWSNATSPSLLPSDVDPRRSEFNIISGTSMATPHVSGIAALLRGAHQDWTPAMIKSAIMTTAYSIDQDSNSLINEMPYDATISTASDMGSGHVDPEKALDPGLVYDLTCEDYVDFLCASNLSKKEIKIITHRSVNCNERVHGNAWDVNYPIISVAFHSSSEQSKNNSMEIVVKRTVTHVSNETSSYAVKVNSPKGVTATVHPKKMVFKSDGEKRSYVVRIATTEYKVPCEKMSGEFGQVIWTDGKHNVTSPLVVTWHATVS